MPRRPWSSAVRAATWVLAFAAGPATWVLAFAAGPATWALAGASTFIACDSQKDNERAEARQVFHALEFVRGAPNEQKRRPADELAHTPCNSPIVCSARDSCAEAYQHLATGTEAALRVKVEIDRLEADPPDSSAKVIELSQELDRADREINGAKDSLRRCEDAAQLMRRTYGI